MAGRAVGVRDRAGNDPADRFPAKEELIRKWGYEYEKQLKNAIEILQFADENYVEGLEKSGLGNYPPLIIALNELGEELQPKYKEADKQGSMREASLKAFRADARERVNKLITSIEADYAQKRGGIPGHFTKPE